jgi:hyperosmotically inducible protein
MRFKLAGIVATATLAVSFAGCNPTTNENANTRANANANTAVNENANANANASTRRAPTRAEYEKNKQTYAEEAKTLGRKIGTGIDDGWLWTKTRFDLAAADDLKDSTINVDVQNAVVTLSGSVDNAQQKAKADSIAKAVAGVKSVKNLLTVTSKTSGANANSNKKSTPKR